jgi:hypothetical protein
VVPVGGSCVAVHPSTLVTATMSTVGDSGSASCTSTVPALVRSFSTCSTTSTIRPVPASDGSNSEWAPAASATAMTRPTASVVRVRDLRITAVLPDVRGRGCAVKIGAPGRPSSKRRPAPEVTAVSQPVNRVSHVVWCVHPEHFDEVTDFWAKQLGVEFEAEDLPIPGLRVRFSAESGIEVIAPTGDDAPAPIREFLETHGEGVYHVMYGVTDIDAVAERVEASGLPVVNRISYAGRPPWSERYAVLEERFLDPRHGTRVGLVEMRRRDWSD